MCRNFMTLFTQGSTFCATDSNTFSLTKGCLKELLSYCTASILKKSWSLGYVERFNLMLSLVFLFVLRSFTISMLIFVSPDRLKCPPHRSRKVLLSLLRRMRWRFRFLAVGEKSQTLRPNLAAKSFVLPTRLCRYSLVLWSSSSCFFIPLRVCETIELDSLWLVRQLDWYLYIFLMVELCSLFWS
jgi:hypothetical protein